jgi:hypothetical protein
MLVALRCSSYLHWYHEYQAQDLYRTESTLCYTKEHLSGSQNTL